MEQTDVKEYVIELLKSHNALEQERKMLLYEQEQLMKLSEDETIESMTFATGSGERVDSGGVSNRTMAIALNYRQKHEEQKAQALLEISSRIDWIEDTFRRLDFYIDGLEAHQASIFRDYYFEGYTWRELQDLRGVTYKTLMKHRDDAVEALAFRYARLERIGLIQMKQDIENLRLK